MIAVPLWLVPALPLALVALSLIPGARPVVRALVPVAPLPALLAALADPVPAPVRLDWLLLGTEFAVTGMARVFLAFTALLWALSAWQAIRLLAADAGRDRFITCFLLAMTGNLGLLLAQDIAAFYTFFAAMSLASWGLVLHAGGPAQMLAGRVYISFAVAGEIALFAGLSLGAFATGEVQLAAMASLEVPALATVLMSVGFLVKLGAVPLHLWLPLAHAAAPAPASAVLSGAMLKAGLFGLMTVLPLGSVAAPESAAALAAMALTGLILAPALGLLQADPKAVLAYSSVGQMSLMALGLAAALAAPEAWPAIGPALVLLAAHHAFAKAALFLGVPAVWASSGPLLRSAVIVGLAVPALALAGLPGTTGWVAKDALKTALGEASFGWHVWLGAALFVSSLGTSLLMLRAGALLIRIEARPGTPRDVGLPWLAMTGLVVAGLWVVPVGSVAPLTASLQDLAPLAAAALLAGLFVAGTRAVGLRLAPMPPGEILALLQRAPTSAPVLALPAPPRRGHALVPRRREPRLPRPERGALAILTVAAALALAMAVTAPEPPPQSQATAPAG
ncbi:proton-conducting transporter membrane subunit [Roseivivax halodurans]|nr:proton-conducting transporter membrane subunit [Roseivivax halodurans]